MTDTIYMCDVDGSGSLHPCWEGDPGAIKYVLASTVITRPKYEIGDEVIAMTHTGHMFTGFIRHVNTDYYKTVTSYTHQYRIVKAGQKRGIYVSEQNIKGLKND